MIESEYLLCITNMGMLLVSRLAYLNHCHWLLISLMYVSYLYDLISTGVYHILKLCQSTVLFYSFSCCSMSKIRYSNTNGPHHKSYGEIIRCTTQEDVQINHRTSTGKKYSIEAIHTVHRRRRQQSVPPLLVHPLEQRPDQTLVPGYRRLEELRDVLA